MVKYEHLPDYKIHIWEVSMPKGWMQILLEVSTEEIYIDIINKPEVKNTTDPQIHKLIETLFKYKIIEVDV